jgi:hypothetical protein
MKETKRDSTKRGRGRPPGRRFLSVLNIRQERELAERLEAYRARLNRETNLNLSGAAVARKLLADALKNEKV